jgi:hypothetical protein
MTRLLQISLILNLVLLGMAWRRSGPGDASGSRITIHPPPPATAFKRLARATTVTTAPPTPWAALDTTDSAQLIANLRAIGCPEQTIRDLVVFRICGAYRARLLEAETWAARSWDYTRDRDQEEWRRQQAERSRLRNQMMSEIESALGLPFRDLSASILGWPTAGSSSEYLSLDKRRQVREIEQRYSQLSQELTQRQFMGGLDAEDQAQLDDWSRQQEAELAAFLTPAELEERFYRDSEAAHYVRQSLPPAQSETEYRLMVKLAAEYDLADHPHSFAVQYGMPGAEQEPGVQDYQTRKAAFDERLKEVLGEQRIAEQTAAEQARLEAERLREEASNQQQALAELTHMAASVGLGAEDAQRFFDRLLELQPELEKQMTEFEQSLTGTAEEKRKQTEVAARTLMENLAVETLGEKGRDLVDKLGNR